MTCGLLRSMLRLDAQVVCIPSCQEIFFSASCPCAMRLGKTRLRPKKEKSKNSIGYTSPATLGSFSPDTKKFFCKSVFHTKATPFMGRNHFWTGFWERGHD